MEFKIYNTLSRQVEVFTPLKKGQATIYSCGPTVYADAHIGNFRSFLTSDLLLRVLRLAGYQVTKIQNITDVGHLTQDDLADAAGEDKLIRSAKSSGKTVWEIADFFMQRFLEDEKLLGIVPPSQRPKATDYIPQQIALTQKLLQRGLAYEVNGSVYFHVPAFPEYGKLSGNPLDQLQAGARVEISAEKKHQLDFALWKAAPKDHLMQWDSPWGRGFPGWHIECSAMSQALLGSRFDFHTGGEDNIFPHHECEIAQNEGCCDHSEPSVNYWVHSKHLLVNNEKMSKSKGNFFTVRDLQAQGWSGAEIRWALLAGHYRSALNFTESSLTQARSNWQKLEEWSAIFSTQKPLPDNQEAPDWIQSAQTQWRTAWANDLNVSEALAAIFQLRKETMKRRDQGTLNSTEKQALRKFSAEIWDLLGGSPLLPTAEKQIPTGLESDLRRYQALREQKDWTAADQLRDLWKNQGIELIVNQAGAVEWRKTS